MHKRYKITHPASYWECEVEVNDEFIIQSLSKPDEPYTALMGMKEMIAFWVGGGFRLDMNNGNIINTFLQQIGREIFLILAENDYNVKGVVDAFENREGWFKMDGTFGIKITDVEDLDFPQDEFEVEELS